MAAGLHIRKRAVSNLGRRLPLYYRCRTAGLVGRFVRGRFMDALPHRIVSVEFTDVDQFALAQPDGDAEHMQLGAGLLRLRMTHGEFGPVTVQCNRLDNAYLARARFRPDRVAMFFDIGAEPGASRLNGFTMGRSGAVLFGPGAELHARAESGQRWAMITLDQGRLDAILDGARLPREGVCGFSGGLLQHARGLPVLAREFAAVASLDPTRLSGEAAAGAVVESVLGQIALGLGPEEPPPRAGRRQVRLVAAAVERIEASLGAPVYTQTISEALGIGARPLNDAFRAVYGITLQRYLQIRRLTLARRSLRDGGGPALVKQVALDCGFWHFGRFALAYRGQFGESPSQTLAGRGGRSAVAVRPPG
jgi:AraC-like DNA-binding protein